MKLVLIGLVCGGVLSAQTGTPAFDVASIKLSRSGPGHSATHSTKGRIEIENQTLKRLLERAYDVRDFSLLGPEWLDENRFDIVAVPPEGAPQSQFMPMLQTLLTERFHVKVHWMKQAKAGYALVVVKTAVNLEQALEKDSRSSDSTRGGMNMKATSMKYFAGMLGQELGQPVQDMTGLAGTYNMRLNWDSDPSVGPSLFTALQEQLGLKLRAQKVEVDVLVVDSAEKMPTEN